MNSLLRTSLSVMALLGLSFFGCAPGETGSRPGGPPEGQSANDAAATPDPSDSNALGKADEIAKGKTDEETNSKPDTLEAAAKKLIGQLANDQFAEATKDFDGTMKQAMPAQKLQKTWTTLIGQVGKLREQGQGIETKVGKYEVVSVKCVFERASLDAEVSFNRDRQIAGLFFRPAKTAPRPKDPRTSSGTLSPVPTYISSGVCPRNAACGSRELCSRT